MKRYRTGRTAIAATAAAAAWMADSMPIAVIDDAAARDGVVSAPGYEVDPSEVNTGKRVQKFRRIPR